MRVRTWMGGVLALTVILGVIVTLPGEPRSARAQPEGSSFFLIDQQSKVYNTVVVAAGEKIKIEKAKITGNLHSNRDIDLKKNSAVLGNVSAVARAHIRGMVSGAVSEGAEPLTLPLLPDEETLRELANRVFEENTNFTDEVVDDIIFVDGDAHFEGGLNGVGTIIATGDITIGKEDEVELSGFTLSFMATLGNSGTLRVTARDGGKKGRVIDVEIVNLDLIGTELLNVDDSPGEKDGNLIIDSITATEVRFSLAVPETDKLKKEIEVEVVIDQSTFGRVVILTNGNDIPDVGTVLGEFMVEDTTASLKPGYVSVSLATEFDFNPGTGYSVTATLLDGKGNKMLDTETASFLGSELPIEHVDASPGAANGNLRIDQITGSEVMLTLEVTEKEKLSKEYQIELAINDTMLGPEKVETGAKAALNLGDQFGPFRIGNLVRAGERTLLDDDMQISLIAFHNIRIRENRRFRGVAFAGHDVVVEKKSIVEGVLIAGRRVDIKKESIVRFVNFAMEPTNLAPVLAPIGNQIVSLGSGLSLTLSASDPDGDPVTFGAIPLPLPANAMLNAATGVFTFNPDETQVGSVQLVFQAKDGRGKVDTETVTINVEGPAPGDVTALTGRLLDTNDSTQGTETPVVGAIVSLLGPGVSTASDANGFFTLTDIPAGSQILDIDATTATLAPDGSTYSSFREKIELIPGVVNVVVRPFFLPRIAAESLTTVDPTITTMVENPTLNVMIEVPPFTAKSSDGTDFTGELSISVVPEGLAPAALPPELQPGLLITIQPVGVTFQTPVPITFPNIDNLTPGSQTDIWSLDPETGTFVVVGTGRVSDDGSVVETISGGVRAADWHMTLPPGTDGGTDNSEHNEENQGNEGSGKCQACAGSTLVSLQTGGLTLDPPLPSHRSLGVERFVELIYNSLSADPRPIIPFDSTILFRAAVPETLSYTLEVAGIQQGTEVFIDTSSLSENFDETIRNGVQFDAREFPTGRYSYRLLITSNYLESSVSTVVTGDVLITNDTSSVFGAGWGIDGLSKLHENLDGSVLIADGNGSAVVFSPEGNNIARLELGASISSFSSRLEFPGCGPCADPRDVIGGSFSSYPSGEKGRFIFGDGDLDQFIVVDLGNTRLIDRVGSAFSDGTSDREVFDFFEVLTSTDGVNFVQRGIVGKKGVGDPLDFTLAAPVVFDINPPQDARYVKYNFGRHSPDHGGGGSRVIRVGVRPARGFANPPGDFSTLISNSDGTFSRVFKDGTTTIFNSEGFHTSTTDRNGNSTVYGYDPLGRLITISDPVGLVTTLTYGPAGLLSTVTDPAGRVSTFLHNAANDLTATIYPDGSAEVFEYDGHNLLTKQTDQRGFSFTHEYDFAGRFIRTIEPDGGTRELAASQTVGLVDTSGGLGSQANPAPIFRPEDAQGLYADPNGNIFVLETNSLGAFTSREDSLGRVTSILRDEDGNPTQITRPNGAVTTMTYDDRGNLLTLTEESINATTSFTYEPNFNQITSTTDPNGNTTNIEYDANGNPIEITDALGTTTVLEYDDPNCSGQLTRVTNAAGLPSESTTTFEHDPVTCNTLRTIDPLGNASDLEYDIAGNVIRSTDSEGRVTRFQYDVMNRPSRVIDATNSELDPDCGTDGVTCYHHDEKGNLIRVTDSRASETSFEYDNLGRVISSVDPLGNSETFSYDHNGNLLSTTDRIGQEIEFEYDTVNQLLRKVWLPGTAAEAVTTFDYDLVGNLISVINPDSSLTTSFDLLGRLISASTAGSPSQPRALVKYSYDKNGNRTSMTTGDREVYSNSFEGLVGPEWSTTLTDITPLGARRFLGRFGNDTASLTLEDLPSHTGVKVSFDLFIIQTWDGNHTEFGPDVWDLSVPGGPVLLHTTFSNFALSRQAYPETFPGGDHPGRTEAVEHNTLGFIGEFGSHDTVYALNFTFPHSETSVNLDFSALGLSPLDDESWGIDNVTVGLFTDTAIPTLGLNYTYDELNRLTTLSRSEVSVAYVANGDFESGDLTAWTSGGINGGSAFVVQEGTCFSFNDTTGLTFNGDVAANVRPSGPAPIDSIGILTSDQFVAGTEIRFQALTEIHDGVITDDPVTLEVRILDGIGNVLSSQVVATNIVTLDVGPCPSGDPRDGEFSAHVIDTSSVAGQNIMVEFRQHTNVPGSGFFTLIDDVEVVTNNGDLVTTFAYDALSRRTDLVLPNGITTTYSYDPASQLLDLVNQLTGSPAPIASFSYTYDAVGNRLTMSQVRTAFAVNPVLSYTYDALNRLVQAANPLPTMPDETFDYDPVGNRLLREGQSVASDFDDANRLLEDEEFIYIYDANGNLTQKVEKATTDTTNYTYDPEDQLIRIDLPSGVVAGYRYDGLGRRIEKDVDGTKTRYVYDNEDILLEFDDSDNLLARYTHGSGIDEPLIMERDLDNNDSFGDDERFFYVADGLGSIMGLTDSTGAGAKAYVYDSFGRIVDQIGALLNPYTYTGREFDTESGLYYFRARYYDAELGRFLQEDPVSFNSGHMNFYNYAQLNPVTLVDPTGLFAIDPGLDILRFRSALRQELNDKREQRRRLQTVREQLRERVGGTSGACSTFDEFNEAVKPITGRIIELDQRIDWIEDTLRKTPVPAPFFPIDPEDFLT